MYGTDQAVSLDPASFHTLVQAVRSIERALGDGALGQPTRDEVSAAERLRAQHPTAGGDAN